MVQSTAKTVKEYLDRLPAERRAVMAAQKNNYALHLMCVYQDASLAAALRRARGKSGRKLDMGKSCIRFKTLDHLPLALIGKIVAGVPLSDFLATYERSRNAR